MQTKGKMVIGEIHERLSAYDMEGSFDQLIATITEMKERCARLNLSNARLGSVGKEYDDGYELAVIYDRPMNDAELALEAENERRSEQYQRAEYERLRKRFGNQ